MDYKLDYEVSFNCTIKGLNSIYYLINFQHINDFDFFAIYREVLSNGDSNYYLFHSAIEDTCTVPKAILINDINIDYNHYINHRDEILKTKNIKK